MEVGCRVVRGPDWSRDNDDFGEGHVGTIVDVGKPDNVNRVPEDQVSVFWDIGITDTYRCGADNKFDLRLLDNAPTGVKHPFHSCASCGEAEIRGMRWECTESECSDFNLCTVCYFTDKHNLDHPFKRYTTSWSKGIIVSPRKQAPKVEAKGFYRGANVIPGQHWPKGNPRDFGKGTVLDLRNFDDRSVRGGVVVKWERVTTPQVHRVGHNGKVDLLCTTSGSWHNYYRDHLPNVGQDVSTIPEGCDLYPGDLVQINMSREEYKNKMSTEKQWNPDMEKALQLLGSVIGYADCGQIRVQYKELDVVWLYSKDLLTKVEQLQTGDMVEITNEASLFKKWCRNINNQQTKKILGKTGIVLNLFPNGDIHVLVKEMAIQINRICCKKKTEEIMTKMFSKGLEGTPFEMISPWIAYANRQPVNLFQLVKSGCTAEIEQFLSEYPEMLNSRNSEDETPLHIACYDGRTDIVKMLLKKHPQIVSDKHGKTPIHLAVYKNWPEILKMLLNEDNIGVKTASKCDEHGMTPLHIAASIGATECMSMLLSSTRRAKWLINTKEILKGNTALHLAIIRGCQSAVDLLLENGADLKAVNDVSFTAMHMAVLLNNQSAIQSIGKKDRSTINVKSKHGISSLHVAIFQTNEIIVKYLLEIGADANDCFQNKSNLAMAITNRVRPIIALKHGIKERQYSVMSDEKRYEDCLKCIEHLAKKADLENSNEIGEKAIHTAAMLDQPDVLEMLIKLGAQVDSLTNNQHTALHYAVFQSHIHSVKVLLEHGASVLCKDQDNHSALDTAIYKKNDAIVRLILQKLPDITLKPDLVNVTVAWGTSVILKAVLEKVPDTIDNKCDGVYPIQEAVACKKPEMLKLLLQAGADINVQSAEGDTSLLLACAGQYCSPEMVEILINKGADINIENYEGGTALFYALCASRTNIIYDRAPDIQMVYDKIIKENDPVDGSFALACYLLKHGADMDYKNKDGHKALDLFVVENRVQKMLEAYFQLGNASQKITSKKRKRRKKQAPPVNNQVNEASTSTSAQIQENVDIAFTFSYEADGETKINLSKGGASRVDKGEYKGRAVAIKEVYAVELDPKRRREYDILNKTEESRHRNVIGFYGSNTRGSLHHLVLEYCQATLKDFVEDKYMDSLKDKFDCESDASPDELLSDILAQCLNGIEYLHRNQIVHRDIKPSNILLKVIDMEITAKIGDFGLAKISADGKDITTARATQGWMAPELSCGPTQGTRCGIDKPVDTFGMGLCIYYTLSGGGHPFGDTDIEQQAAINDNIAPQLDQNICIEARDLVGRMLRYKADDRPCISECIAHPYFMTSLQRLNFITNVSNYITEETDDIAKDLDKNPVNWCDLLGPEMKQEMKGSHDRKRKPTSMLDFIKIIRNKSEHYQTLPRKVKTELCGSSTMEPNKFMQYFTDRVPELVLHVYRVAETHIKGEPSFQRNYHFKATCTTCKTQEE